MADEPVTVDVRFTLVSATDNAPLADAPIRLVLGKPPGWQEAGAGTRFVTDANGEYRFAKSVVLESQLRKKTSNFFTQLMSSAQETKHLTAAVELPYLGHPWLYVIDVDYFADGTSAQMDGMRLYGTDSQGAFTVPGTMKDNIWTLPGIPGVLNVPGHDVSRFTIEPDETGARWSVSLTVKRHPEPVLR